MVLLLNYALLIITLVALLVAYIVLTSKAHNKGRKLVWLGIGLLLTLVMYRAAQPSYLPKSSIARSEVPAFESTDAKITDRQLKPVSGAERDKKRAEQSREKLPFIESK